MKIREEVTDLVDYRPGCLFRRQIIRPVYASFAHATAPRIAPLPPRVVPGGQVGSGLVAHVVISKFCDHLPIHRQEQMLARLGPTFTRQAMGQWVSHATLLLQSVIPGCARRPLPAATFRWTRPPFRSSTPSARARPATPGSGPSIRRSRKIIVFEFHKNRSHAPPKQLLDGFQGVLQTDGFSSYDTALKALPGHQVIRAACMAHARRGFMAALDSGDDRTTPFLVLFGQLYKIEAEARDLDPQARAHNRAERSVPVLLQLQQRLRSASTDLTVLPQSDLAKAVNYCLVRWSELCLFADPGYGYVQIDNNPIERQIRPTKLGLRNWLFIGHPDAGDNPAVIYSIIGTCKLLKIDPWAYLNWALPGLAAATNHTAADFTPQRFTAL